MTGFAGNTIIEEFWIFHDSEYAKFLHMQTLHEVHNMPEYGWIMSYCRVLNLLDQASGSKYARAQNMARFRTCEDYTRCWICLKKREYALIMSQYAWICLNIAEYDWICWHIPEKHRVLNMPEFWKCLLQYIA